MVLLVAVFFYTYLVFDIVAGLPYGLFFRRPYVPAAPAYGMAMNGRMGNVLSLSST